MLAFSQKLIVFMNDGIPNDITLSIDKCKVISFSRKLRPFTLDYNIHNKKIENATVVRVLGILLGEKLTSDDHYLNIVNKTQTKC